MFLIKKLKKKRDVFKKEKKANNRRTSIEELFNLKGCLILPMFRHERWICGQLAKCNHLATGPHTWVASQLLPYLLSPLWCAAAWQEEADGREQEHCRTGRVSSWFGAIFTAVGCLCLGEESWFLSLRQGRFQSFQCLERESQSLRDFAICVHSS